MGRVMQWWGGIRVHREAYGDMGRVIEWWGGIGGHGQGQAEVGRHTGT